MREGAPLPSEGAGAEMNELGFPRTCRPGGETDPNKKRNSERHTTQHAGKVQAKDTGGGERAHGDTKARTSRPPGAGARWAKNSQGAEGNTACDEVCATDQNPDHAPGVHRPALAPAQTLVVPIMMYYE